MKAKMCETIPYVNAVGTQSIAARAKIELACEDCTIAHPLMARFRYAHHAFPCRLAQRNSPLSPSPHTYQAPRAGCRVWKPADASTRQELQELNPDVIVKCYLDAKHYRCDPVELAHLVDVYANFANLVNEDTTSSQ